MSVECTPQTLVSMSSSPSPLSDKLCPTSVHRSLQEFEFYSIVNMLKSISYTIGIFGRAVVGCPSNAHLKVRCLSAKLCPMCVHRSVQELEFYCIFSRLMPISYARGILWRAVGLCPSNAHHQVWCLSAPFHHLCLLNFVPCVCIDPFKS